jgi:hypothetical protein
VRSGRCGFDPDPNTISFAIGGTPFTLVIPPILAVALFLSVRGA